MWDHIWYNLSAATMQGPDYGLIEDAALAAHQGRIVYIGPRANLPAPPEQLAQTCTDAAGALITPGLIDAHTHLAFAGDRAGEFEERLHGASYADIARRGGGIMASVRATRAIDEAGLTCLAIARARLMIQAGVTTLEIKSGYGLTLQDEAKQLRAARAVGRALNITVRTSFLGAHTLPPEFAGRRDDYITHLIEVMLPSLADEGLIDAVDGFCESISFTSGEIDRLFTAATKRGLPVKLHADQLTDSNGAALAASHGALSADHLEYTNQAGVAAMAQAGTIAMLLPGAYYYLRETQAPPVDLFRRHGVPMAIASDCNPGTSPLLNPCATMNMACVLFGLTPAEALAGHTINAARALALHADTGTLEVGKYADFALWDVKSPAALSYWIGGMSPLSRVYHGTPD